MRCPSFPHPRKKRRKKGLCFRQDTPCRFHQNQCPLVFRDRCCLWPKQCRKPPRSRDRHLSLLAAYGRCNTRRCAASPHPRLADEPKSKKVTRLEAVWVGWSLILTICLSIYMRCTVHAPRMHVRMHAALSSLPLPLLLLSAPSSQRTIQVLHA